MPLFWEKKSSEFQITIWKVEEEVDELLGMCSLSSEEKKELQSFKSVYRKKEWLCTRIMLGLIMGEKAIIIYDKHGKPNLENHEAEISVAHTKNFVALMTSKTSHSGVDLELIHPRIKKIADKFLSEDEKSRSLEDSSVAELKRLYIIWGAKEVLFKIYGKGELLFKEHLLTEPFVIHENGLLQAYIAKNNLEKRYLINYELINDLLLTYSF